MEKSGSKGLSIAYNVVAVLVALMMSFSASTKFTLHPGSVKVIHETIGVPLGLLPVLGALLVAGGIGLVVGIFRPKIGVAAGVGLVLYFLGAMLAHVVVGDWAGLVSPIVPLLLASMALALRISSLRPRPARG
jgi:hypothetical protein